MDQPVTHSGEIIAIDGHDVTLVIHDTAPQACGGCRLADLCVRADNRGTVTVTVDSTAGLAVGQRVRASVSERSQGIAVVWSLLMPLVIFTALIVPLAASALPRWAVVAIAVGVVGVYNLLLWRFGPRVSRSLKWNLTVC